MNFPETARVSVAVDVVVLTVQTGRLKVLLTQLGSQSPASPDTPVYLPSEPLHPAESADEAAQRALKEQAKVVSAYVEQLYTFTAPQRARPPSVPAQSPSISVSYLALLKEAHPAPPGAFWSLADHPPQRLPKEHREILETALTRIRGKLSYTPIGFSLLPQRFTLTELQRVHEAVLGHELDKRNFRNKLLRSDLIREVEAFRTGSHRPARLYEYAEMSDGQSSAN